MKKILSLVLFCFSVAINPSSANSSNSEYTNLIVEGNTFWSKGNLENAKNKFLAAIDLNDDISTAHSRLANLYLTQNKTSKAIDEFQNAITIEPENAHLFIGIAIAYLHKQHYEMAESMVNHAIELKPDLDHVKKLKKYIDLKKDVLEKTASIDINKPNDSIHNSTQNSMNHKPATMTKRLESNHK